MMLTVRELRAREDFFDAAIYRHGFVDYMRDYEIIVGGRREPWTDLHRYQFIGCTEAHCETMLQRLFTESITDQFVYAGRDYPDADEPDGFIWGVRWSCAYPGLTYVENGERARWWSKVLGRPMHEILLETNAFRLSLVFADLRYEPVTDPNQIAALDRKDYPIAVHSEDVTSDGGVGYK